MTVWLLTLYLELFAFLHINTHICAFIYVHTYVYLVMTHRMCLVKKYFTSSTIIHLKDNLFHYNLGLIHRFGHLLTYGKIVLI